MEVHIVAICAALLSFLLVNLWRILNQAYLRPRHLQRFLKEQGLNGTDYKLFSGDLNKVKQIIQKAIANPIKIDDDIKPRVAAFLQKTFDTYGNDCFVWNGTRPTVIINDPELAREVFTKTQVFVKQSKFNSPSVWRLFRGIIAYSGEKWSQHRKILNPAFHLEKLKLMVPAFRLSCEEVLSKWDSIVASDASGELDVWPYLQEIASDAISRTAFGSNFKEGRKVFELVREQAVYVKKDAVSTYIPGTRFLPTKRNKRMNEIEGELQLLIRGMIDRRINSIKAGKSNSDDLLKLLLESNIQEVEQQGNGSFGMSMKEVVDECILFYIAGQETTSTLILWTMVLLSRHQEWQQRAREEVVGVFGTETPNYEGLAKLQTVNMILHEVLRLYPPITTLSRQVSKEIKLRKLTLPADIDVQLPIIFLHHNTDVWGEDATEFNPERFSEGVSKAMKRNGIFCPFGWGPRICIAQNFALLEAKVAISMILQRFSFELSSSYSHAPFSKVTIQPQHGAHLILHKI